jgi:excisionase family DNA binding protein
MEADKGAAQRSTEQQSPLAEAPTPRARALREEIFGSALNLDEASYILSLDRTTVAKYLREKTLYGFQIGREWLIPEEELRAYVRRVTQGSLREEPDATPREQMRGLLERMRHDLLGGRRRERAEHPPKSAIPVEAAGRFDKFTQRARNVLTLAQEEARGFNHNYIGTEHLLLGLVREGEGVAAKVLTNLGVELYRARSAVEFIIGRGTQPSGEQPLSGQIGLTPRAKKVLQLAVDEARRLGHHYIGTEHLLLGLVREGEGIAAGVLESLGINLDRVRTETIRVLSSAPRKQPAAADVAESAPAPAPPEAAGLVDPDKPALRCLRCDAHNPTYFHYCFNCGVLLRPAD